VEICCHLNICQSLVFVFHSTGPERHNIITTTKVAFVIGLSFIVITIGVVISKIRHTDYGQSGAHLE
jgi:hypothetical protein